MRVGLEQKWVPAAGDVIFVDFNPTAGHEQAGERPAVVLTEENYNRASKLCIVVPVTTKTKGYPCEVPLPEGLGVEGFALCDHIRSVDWDIRRTRKASSVPDETLREIRAMLAVLMSIKTN